MVTRLSAMRHSAYPLLSLGSCALVAGIWLGCGSSNPSGNTGNLDGSGGAGRAGAGGGSPASGGAAGNGQSGTQGQGGSANGGSTGTSACTDPALGCPCPTKDARGCVAGHAQKSQLVCDGSKWGDGGTCTADLLCDSSPGPNQGTCQPVAAGCAGHKPGESVCSGNNKVTCGPDLVSSTSTPCPFLCTNGDCGGVCAPGTKGCNGKQAATCDASGQWSAGTACPSDCAQGACCSATLPTACGTSCVNLQTDKSNCGACGKACTSPQTCSAGKCGTVTNLVKNGDFSEGMKWWEGENLPNVAVVDGAFCATFSGGGGSGIVGYAGHANSAQAVPLTAGASYTLSYTAWTTATLSGYEAKVSHATGPFTTDFSSTTDVLTEKPADFTHTFTTAAADTGAGIAFMLTASGPGKTCFKNVSLVQN